MRKIKRDDEVIVLAGKDKGKRGKVVKLVGDQRLIVSGVNIVKKHQKPNPQANVAGGIIEKEAPVHNSKLMLIDPQTDEPTRIRRKRLENGKRIRLAIKSGEQISEAGS